MNGTALILHASLAGLAAALFLLMPSQRADARRMCRAGLILLTAALAALAVQWLGWIGDSLPGGGFFVVFAFIAIAAGARVVTHPRPVYSAVYFVLLMLAVTGLCILAGAEFLAVALVIVYVGAILVTYVFVIMFAQQGGSADYDLRAREPLAAVALSFLLMAGVGQATFAEARTDGTAAGILQPEVVNGAQGNVRSMGQMLMTDYVAAVQIGGLLLLVAMIGAVAVARKRIDPEEMTSYERDALREPDLTRIGREVEPF